MWQSEKNQRERDAAAARLEAAWLPFVGLVLIVALGAFWLLQP